MQIWHENEVLKNGSQVHCACLQQQKLEKLAQNKEFSMEQL